MIERPIARFALLLALPMCLLPMGCEIVRQTEIMGEHNDNIGDLTRQGEALQRENAGLVAQREGLLRELQTRELGAAELAGALEDITFANNAARTVNDKQRQQKREIDAKFRALRDRARAIAAANAATAKANEAARAAQRKQLEDVQRETRDLLVLAGQISDYAKAPAAGVVAK